MHSTKLPLWKWLLAIYYILNSSKGISSVFLSRLIGVKQSTAWKMGHAIRLMMDSWAKELHKGGKATAKQSILVAIQRQGPVFPVPVDTVKTDTISPIIYAVADTSADLMTDKSYVFQQTGKQFASHQSVYHMAKEYARGNVHINTAESFNAMLERVKTGVFHYMSPKHLGRYLTELSFRWSNRDPKEVVTKMGKKKTIWTPKPIIEQLTSLLPFACGTQLRWKRTGAVRQIT
jgi:hypothetical protein